jgi:hypothetical protein
MRVYVRDEEMDAKCLAVESVADVAAHGPIIAAITAARGVKAQ